MRIAKTYTGGTGFIVTETAYHGVTAAVAGLSPSLGPALRSASTCALVPAPARRPAPTPARPSPRGVRAAIADLQRHGIKPAALLVDTIFSSDGVFADPAGFLHPAVEAIRDAGGVFIADEVQPGFGRTGEAMWGFARHGLVPDLVTMGKPMGNGHPMAGMVVRPEIARPNSARSRAISTPSAAILCRRGGHGGARRHRRPRACCENARLVGATCASVSGSCRPNIR